MVTHSIGAMKEYCQHGLVLADGELRYFANVDDAIETYRKLNM
jgi:capsular polysaccharide transport system ATP-binding protein